MKSNFLNDYTGRFFLINNEVKAVHDFDGIVNNRIAGSNSMVYEVIRIINGKPLFYEDHYERMNYSMNMLGVIFKTDEAVLYDRIKKVCQNNDLTDCNVKVLTYTDSEQNTAVYISKSYYPNAQEIAMGVNTALFSRVRSNPNAKLLNSSYKEDVSRKIMETGAFELLLVNNDGNITEGSKANVFFIKNNKVLTAPDEYILKGITRKYVLEACKRCGIDVSEELVNINELTSIEGLFLSGTSIKVLPVRKIDEYHYNSGENELIADIRKNFDNIISEYLNK